MATVSFRRFRCRFCGLPFDGDARAIRLLTWFCPRCVALYLASVDAVRRFEESDAVEAFGACAYVFPSNLPRRQDRSA